MDFFRQDICILSEMGNNVCKGKFSLLDCPLFQFFRAFKSSKITIGNLQGTTGLGIPDKSNQLIMPGKARSSLNIERSMTNTEYRFFLS